MNHPSHLSDADWAEYLKCQDEHDDLMEQVTEREAQMENGLIDTYDEYEFDFTTQQTPEPRPARPIPPRLHAPASRRRSRRR